MQECWPPFVAGAVIGCLQIPLVLSVSDTLGKKLLLFLICEKLFGLIPGYFLKSTKKEVNIVPKLQH